MLFDSKYFTKTIILMEEEMCWLCVDLEICTKQSNWFCDGYRFPILVMKDLSW